MAEDRVTDIVAGVETSLSRFWARTLPGVITRSVVLTMRTVTNMRRLLLIVVLPRNAWTMVLLTVSLCNGHQSCPTSPDGLNPTRFALRVSRLRSSTAGGREYFACYPRSTASTARSIRTGKHHIQFQHKAINICLSHNQRWFDFDDVIRWAISSGQNPLFP